MNVPARAFTFGTILATVFIVAALLLRPLPVAQAHGINCDLGSTAAFCDQFDQPFGGTPFGNGTRTGALDPSRWGVSRLSGQQDPNQGYYNRWLPGPAQFCRNTIQGVKPDGDYFMCGPEFGESMHFMESINDDDNYVFNSAKILQPFDFTNRTGTFTFDVDAKTNGGHSWWVEVWLTDQPVNAPHVNNTFSAPRNGVAIDFSDNCGIGGPPGTEDGGGCTRVVFQHVRGYQQVGRPSQQTGQITTARDAHNHLVVKINQQRMEVWATDAVGHGQDATLKLIGVADNMNLPFTTGWLHVQHAHYAAAKFNAAPYQTYHWDNIGFDGPKLVGPRQYSVKDSLTSAAGGGGRINVGYKAVSTGMEMGPQTIPNVDLTGAKSAYLLSNSFQSRWEWRVNSGPWHLYQSIDPPGDPWNVLQQYVEVPLGELRQGNNTVDFRMTNPIGILSNIDLLVFGDGSAPQPTAVPTSTPMPTSTPQPTNTPVPPTATPTPTSTAVPILCEIRTRINGVEQQPAGTWVSKPPEFCAP